MKKRIVSSLLAIVMATTLAVSNVSIAYAAAPNWDATSVYTGGSQVTYDGKTYEAQWWTQGEKPGSSQWGAWKLVDDATEPTDPVEPTETVEPTDPVEPSETAQPTEEPGTGASAWNAATAYPGGSQVTYEGKTYEAKWWTQGEVPGSSEWGAWKLVDDGATQPTETVEPTEPTETVEPTEPTETVEPTEPTETVEPTEPTETVEPTEPTETVEPTEPTETVEPTEPTETVEPTEPTEEPEVPEGDFYQTTNINGVEYPSGYWDRKVVGYFPNYAIEAENHAYFSITDLQWDKLTHVQYAFVVADENTLEMVPSDPKNDVENKFEDRKFYHKGKEIKMDDTLGYYGQFNLMHTMQKMYPDVTVLASTGGWAASRTLWLVTDNEANMNKFADSAVEFVRKYGFDGIDIDFEFPSETSQSGNPNDFDLSEPRRAGIADRYAKLVKILRDKFDEAAKEDGRYYWVTSAVSASSWVLGGQTNASYLDYFDFVSIMSYDYHGGWNQFVENQANIYPDPADTETKSMAVPTLGFDWSFKYYRGEVQSEKILMGIPYYTRGWTNVNGGTNGLHGSSKTPATGIENIWHDLDSNGNETPAGANPLWHVLNLMNEEGSAYKKYWDPVGRVPYVWNDQTRTFLTFEDEQSIQERINYIDDNNLGGCLIWVMHGDFDYDAEQDKYVVGDTLTTMLHDQLEKMGPAQLTSDIDLSAEVLDFDVDFGGKYDHPNYTYAITVTNHTGQDFDKWTISFDVPNSAVFGSSWGGQATVTPSKNAGFTTVTLAPGWEKLPNGASVTLQGMIKLNFAGVKNFKLNGCAMKSEVEEELARVYRGTK